MHQNKTQRLDLHSTTLLQYIYNKNMTNWGSQTTVEPAGCVYGCGGHYNNETLIVTHISEP